jgi:PAS domain S-box-containing protein
VSDPHSLKAAQKSAAIPSGASKNPLERDRELAWLIRNKDWSTTPIGPPEQWSPTLRTVVDFLIVNRFPLLLWWGPEYVSIYNDAYRPILGTKHPDALGKPFREVWAEIDHVLRPLIDAPFNGGPATWMDDIMLEVKRHGFTEETHFTIAYSPVPDDTAPRGIGGVLATVNETTDKIVGERRIIVLRDLGARAGEARTPERACAIAAQALEPPAKDIPFALLYLVDASCGEARLAATAGIEPIRAGVARTVEPGGEQDVWQFARVHVTKSPAVIAPLSEAMACAPPGPWSDPPAKAIVLPIRSSIPSQLAGFLVAGVSPRLRLDDQYRGFLDLVAAQIAASIATAQAYEDERKRAEALAEIDRVKTLFFSNVSHEFRTPLSLIIGPLNDAQNRKQGLDGEQLDLVHRNSLRLLKLVNSLLDFSRIEAGRAKATYSATNLATFTADLASNFASACERAGLALNVDCSPLSAPAFVDRDLWEKVVLNLLANAFKFTFEGGITVALREVDGAAQLTVRDTGVGIPAHELPLLFERFHRIEGQKSRTHEGSGIGLALVQELVNLHGGTISVESEINLGTTFSVSVPLGNAHLPRERVTAGPALPSASVGAGAFVQEALRWLPDATDLSREVIDDVEGLPAALGLDARVLVADDNADMRDYIRRLLQGGCEVRAVADGGAALKEMRKRRPNLVLADVMIPKMDGFQLIAAMRADRSLQHIPVILLSARAGEESRVEGLEAGASDYLVKPFSTRELIARVSGNLELARVRKESTAALRESEERFRALVTASSTIVYRMSPDWTSMLYLLGQDFIPDTNNLSSSWLETYIFPDDHPSVLEAINKAIRSKSLFQLEHRVRRVDGTAGWTLSRAIPRLNADGEIVEWFGSAMDVTERKRAEEEVLALAARSDQQRRLYQTVLSNTPDLVYVFNLNHQFIYANDALLAVWGKSWTQAIGKNCLELGYEPWHAQIHDREIDKVVASKKPIRGEVPFTGTQGRRTYDYIFVPVLGPGGEVEAVAGAARDITDRKEQEVALQHRTAQFATLLSQAPLGVYLIDADFKIRQVNPTAGKVFGAIPNLVGRDFAEVVAILWPKDYADDLVRIFRHTLQTGEPYFMPERVEQRRDRGVVEVYEWQAHRILQPDGRFGVVCYFRDISSQVAARERLTLLVNELNHRVKNTLATIQSVARQSLRNAPNLLEGQRVFDARIVALSKAHDVLTREHWEGASLRKIVAESLAPHAGDASEHRLKFNGPEIRLRPKAALALSMALHELATNAVKYGAFSDANGRVEVGWRVEDDGHFALRWSEEGGPVVSSPRKRGFGSRLIEQGLSQDLGGLVSLDFPSSGVVCSIRAPLAEIGGK